MVDSTEVILVHGLWYRAWSMRVLQGRLQSCGFAVRCFSYPTRGKAPEVNAEALGEFAARVRVDRQHFVAHSLGGLVTLEMLAARDGLPPGRVVLLGSPLQGSVVAGRVSHWPGGDFYMRKAAGMLQTGSLKIPADRETGVIAGVKAMGLGRFTGRLEGPHDGTVRVAETQAEGLADRIELHVTHTGMLVSHDVAVQAASFLRKGRFQRPKLLNRD